MQHRCTHEDHAAERKAAPGELNPQLVTCPTVHEKPLSLQELSPSVATQPKVPSGIPGMEETKHGTPVLQDRQRSTVPRPVPGLRVDPFLERKELHNPHPQMFLFCIYTVC